MQHASATPITLFVGLGNPGTQYVNTRHNAGYWFVHALAQQHTVSFRCERKGHLAKIHVDTTACRLFMADAYMNECGRVIQDMLHFYRISPAAMCVVHDELDLPVGDARLKYSGGHGGHNGLRDLIQQLGTRDFHRLRIGIDHPGNKHQVSSFVLKPPNQDERKHIDNAITNSLAIVPELVSGDIEKAMRILHQ